MLEMLSVVVKRMLKPWTDFFINGVGKIGMLSTD
jgi:hypothetical protein